MNARTAVCIFAKPPRAGEVKTRLASSMGAEGAARLARAFLCDTWANVSARPWARAVLATTEAYEGPPNVSPEDVLIQRGRNLGERLEAILRRALCAHGAALAIGADSPGLPPSVLDTAHEALHARGSVIGPSEDGGFYLIGADHCPPGLFKDIPWSTSAVFEKTCARLRCHGFSPLILPRWFDVDVPADLARLERLIVGGEIDAPTTRQVLESLETHRAD